MLLYVLIVKIHQFIVFSILFLVSVFLLELCAIHCYGPIKRTDVGLPTASCRASSRTLLLAVVRS